MLYCLNKRRLFLYRTSVTTKGSKGTNSLGNEYYLLSFESFVVIEAVFAFLKAPKNKKAANRFFYILQIIFVVLSEN